MLHPSRPGLAKNEPNTNVPVMKVWGSVNNHHIFNSYSSEELLRNCAHLQDEDEVVRGSVADIEVMFWRFLVLLIELQLLDYIRVLQQPQQNLLRHLIRAKCFHFCKGAKHTFVRNVDTNITRTDIQQYTGHTPNCHMYFQCFKTEYIPKVFEISCHYQEFGFWFEVHLINNVVLSMESKINIFTNFCFVTCLAVFIGSLIYKGSLIAFSKLNHCSRGYRHPSLIFKKWMAQKNPFLH